ncbi:unnamed protein product [Owenia fusiformis]|uniref:Uncharacterized protein n=1 Tax=Owenia fusiformis TaxID=6347 RepID=A0A8S4QCM2_OWEFU|nr:unnamed protein product [Owenia fusiformis]
MRSIVVFAALGIIGVFGQTCEKKCEATCEQKCANKCQSKVKPSRCGGPCKFSTECKYECWCNLGICEPMKDIGENCTKNDECKGLSNCVPYGNGICEETCRIDSDCLRYENGKSKYCTVGGFAGTQKGKCEMKHELGYRCARSPECSGKMYCRNGQCQVAEEVVICSLNCHGPDPRKPDNIRPGSIVNITYSCTFIRRAEMGHLNLKADIKLDNVKRLGKVLGLSPQYFNGFVTKKARKGEFIASLKAVMTPCVSNKDSCQANRKCILNAGQVSTYGGTCRFSRECTQERWCNQGMCEPMKDPGERCRSSNECKGLSTCVPLGNGICEETCRTDSDCLQYEYCTVGGRCVMRRDPCENVYCCTRSQECPGEMYCRNGQCQDTIRLSTVAEEVVICSLKCHGPDPRKPDNIRPGHIVNITYSCTFIRRAEMGHKNLKGEINLDNTKRLGVVKGESPQYFSGFVTKKARKGEFTASLKAVMTTCVSNKDSCAANRKCTLNAGQ